MNSGRLKNLPVMPFRGSHNLFFYKLGYITVREPIEVLITQGMILAKTFFCTVCNIYLDAESTNSSCTNCGTTKIIVKDEKISKILS